MDVIEAHARTLAGIVHVVFAEETRFFLPERDLPVSEGTSLFQTHVQQIRPQDRVRINLEATIPTKETIIYDNRFSPEFDHRKPRRHSESASGPAEIRWPTT